MIGKGRSLAVGLVLAMAGALTGGEALGQGAPQPFKIGVVISLTGPFAPASKDTMDGVSTWIAHHGLPGRQIVLATTDDETNPIEAVNAFRLEASDPDVKLIYLFINTNSALAVKAFASEYKVPIISGGGAENLGVPADPWFFKVASKASDTMRAIVAYAKHKGYTRFATFNSTDATGRTEVVDLDKFVPEAGLKMVDEETFAVGDITFGSQIARIRAANPQFLYSGATGREAILFYKQLMGGKPDFPLMVNGAAISRGFYDAIGGISSANGLLQAVQRGVFGPKLSGDSGQLYARFSQELGRPPTYFNIFGYDCGLITGAAVAASDGTRQGIRDALERLKDLPAINGPVTFTPQDHTGQDYRSVGIGITQDGMAIPAE